MVPMGPVDAECAAGTGASAVTSLVVGISGIGTRKPQRYREVLLALLNAACRLPPLRGEFQLGPGVALA